MKPRGYSVACVKAGKANGANDAFEPPWSFAESTPNTQVKSWSEGTPKHKHKRLLRSVQRAGRVLASLNWEK